MKANSVLAIALFLATAFGCREKCEREVFDSVEELGFALLSHESAQELTSRLQTCIADIADDAQRQEAIRLLMKRLLSVPLADKPYSCQMQVMRRISDLITLSVAYRCVRMDEPELRCEIRLALVDWWRNQLIRLKPTWRSAKAVLDWKSPVESQKYREWRSCYMASFLSYRSLVNRVEFWWYPEDENRFGEEVAKRLKAQIEKTLGRPLRKEKHLPEDWKWETDEFMGVREHRLLRTE